LGGKIISGQGEGGSALHSIKSRRTNWTTYWWEVRWKKRTVTATKTGIGGRW